MSRQFAFRISLTLSLLVVTSTLACHHALEIAGLFGIGLAPRAIEFDSIGPTKDSPLVVNRRPTPPPRENPATRVSISSGSGRVMDGKQLEKHVRSIRSRLAREVTTCPPRPDNIAHPVEGSAHPNDMPRDGSMVRDERGIDLISRVYHVDRIYKSMQGPWGENHFPLIDNAAPELVWITGARVSMLAADGRSPMPEWFMCHANFDFDSMAHGRLFSIPHSRSERLFTLSQGQLVVEFPPGCGLPMMSNENLRLITQALNLNFDHKTFDVRHQVRIDFVKDRDVAAPMKPLYQLAANGLVSLDEGEVAYDFTADGNLASMGKLDSMCSPGKSANQADERVDEQGRRFAGHWLVKPGRHTYRNRVTRHLDLPWDTTVHYIAVHLHPTAESITLRDATTGEAVFHAKAKNPDTLLGLERVEHYRSEAGFPLLKDHEYELVSVYHNRGEREVDSMAVLYLYAEDHAFQKPPRRVEVAGVE